MKNRILGSILLLAGTSIGAGMLALPMSSMGLGFSFSLFLLILMWLYSIVTAIIMVEISKGRGQSIATLATTHLGLPAKHVSSVSLLVLYWSLLWCYISAGTSILHQEISLHKGTGIFGFTLLLAIFIAWRTSAVDYVNRFVFTIKIMIFAVILLGLFPFVKVDNLMSAASPTFISVSTAIPIFFTSFGYHCCLPSLIDYLDGHKKSIYISIILGSIIPLLVFIFWQTMTLGIIDDQHLITEDVGVFISHLTKKTQHPYLMFLVNTFAFLAIVTSFLGVALALFQYISETFNSRGDLKDKIKVSLIVFGLPLALTIIYPNGFIMALGCAAVAHSLLSVVLPCFIAFKEKKSPGLFVNKIILGLVLSFGLWVILTEIFSKN